MFLRGRWVIERKSTGLTAQLDETIRRCELCHGFRLPGPRGMLLCSEQKNPLHGSQRYLNEAAQRCSELRPKACGCCDGPAEERPSRAGAHSHRRGVPGLGRNWVHWGCNAMSGVQACGAQAIDIAREIGVLPARFAQLHGAFLPHSHWIIFVAGTSP